MRKALVVGGNSGIGLAITLYMLENGYDFVYITGKETPKMEDIPVDKADYFARHTSFKRIDLTETKFSQMEAVEDIDTLIITAGFGRVAPFESLLPVEIEKLVKCNMLGVMMMIEKYYHRIRNRQDFYCAVM